MRVISLDDDTPESRARHRENVARAQRNDKLAGEYRMAARGATFGHDQSSALKQITACLIVGAEYGRASFNHAVLAASNGEPPAAHGTPDARKLRNDDGDTPKGQNLFASVSLHAARCANAKQLAEYLRDNRDRARRETSILGYSRVPRDYAIARRVDDILRAVNVLSIAYPDDDAQGRSNAAAMRRQVAERDESISQHKHWHKRQHAEKESARDKALSRHGRRRVY